MSEYLSEIKNVIKINKHNKLRAFTIVVVTLVLSFVLVGYGIYKYPPSKCKTKYYTELTTYESNNVVKSLPVRVFEESYNHVVWFLTLCILACVVTFLWGAFTVLFKVLKSEHEMNSKLLDVQNNIYKETQMWELEKLKKTFEKNNLTVPEKSDPSKKEKELKNTSENN